MRARPESTVNKSTTRLGRSVRVDLSSPTSGFKRSRQRRAAGDRTQARVGGFAWVKKLFGIRRDSNYNGPIYKVTGPKVPSSRRRRRAHRRERIVQEEAGVGSSALH